jgi:hypothetical protein
MAVIEAGKITTHGEIIPAIGAPPGNSGDAAESSP